MSPLALTLVSAALLIGSAALALALARFTRTATLVALGGALAGCGTGLGAAIEALRTGLVEEAAGRWLVPGGRLIVGLDPLSAFFLVPLYALGGIAALYGRTYLSDQGEGERRHLAVPAAALNLLLAAMSAVLLARHALLFLVSWEAMVLLSYVLVTFDHHVTEVRRAGWVYLIASHVSALALIALFVALGAQAGGALDFQALAGARLASPPVVAGLFALALVGFGTKAGVVGLHGWLPEAHAAAPSHVSALMSGALIKLGLYGLLRTLMLLPPLPAAGPVLMSLGLVGAVVGIALALYQRDLKRVLAYSSIENVGIVLLGLGFGCWAAARGDGRLASFGFAGALLHVWNHAAMKGLLFLAAGSVLHGAGAKDLEKLGGLMKRMPWTGATLTIGAIAIAGLPPLNGFTGEWLLYRGLAAAGIEAGTGSSLAAVGAIAGLALAGALAVLCFVRIVGITLLGEARAPLARDAHESATGMTAPLVLLAGLCLGIAVAPAWFLAPMAPLVGQLAGGDAAAAGTPATALAPLAACNVALLAAVAALAALLAARARAAARDDTWGCGYVAPTPRMQYTGRSFSELLAERLLPGSLRPRVTVSKPEGLFPRSAEWSSDSADPLTRDAYEPFLARWGDRFVRLRWLQQGNVHAYLAYIMGITVLALTWAAVREWWLR